MITRTCPNCGFTGSGYRSEARADAALAKHSCARHQAITSRADQFAAKLQESGETRDCTHPHARHVHGTVTAYVRDKCRCRPCRDAVNAAKKARYRAACYGLPTGKTDAAPARAHIRALMADGVGFKTIAALAGVPTSTVSSILYGRPNICKPYKRISDDTAARILAVRPDIRHVSRYHIIDSTGTLRRLQALAAIGWSQAELGARLNIKQQNLSVLMTQPRCSVGFARKVQALYDRLWDQRPVGRDKWETAAITKARKHAERKGWLPPLAWDDDTIDDPIVQHGKTGVVIYRKPRKVAA